MFCKHQHFINICYNRKYILISMSLYEEIGTKFRMIYKFKLIYIITITCLLD